MQYVMATYKSSDAVSIHMVIEAFYALRSFMQGNIDNQTEIMDRKFVDAVNAIFAMEAHDLRLHLICLARHFAY